MYFDLIYLLLTGAISIILTYSIGKFISAWYFDSKKIFLSAFVSLSIGAIFIITVFSTFYSGFKTIQLLFFPVFGYLLFRYKKRIIKPRFSFQQIKQELVWTGIIYFALFLYQSYFYFDFPNGHVCSLFWDNYAYASYIDSLRLWGAESRYVDMNYFIPVFRKGLVPYHFSELWFSAFWGKLFSISSIKAYYFSSNTLLVATFVVGIASLFENSNIRKAHFVAISLFLLFIAGLCFSIYGTSNILPSLWFKNMSMMGILGSKMAIVNVYLLLAIVVFLSGETVLGSIILVCVPLLSIGLMPGIWGGMIGLQMFLMVRNKCKRIAGNIEILLLIGFLIIAFAGFYHIFKPEHADDYMSKYIFSHGIFKNIHDGISFNNLKIIIANFIVYTIPTIGVNLVKMIVFFFPFLLIIYRSVIKNHQLWLFSLFALVCGATITSLCSGILDTGQFTSNLSVLMVVLIIVGVSELIISLSFKRKLSDVLLTSIVIGFMGYNAYGTITTRYAMKTWHDDSHSFIKNIADITRNQDTVVCLVFLSKYEYSRQPYLWWYNRCDADIATQYYNSHFIFTLANPELYYDGKPIPEENHHAYNYLTPFNFWKSRNQGKDIVQFIEQFKIKYLYVKKDVVLPALLHSKIKQTICDTHSGTRFIVLK